MQVAVHDMRRVRSASATLEPCTRSARANMQPLPRLPLHVVQREYTVASRRVILLGLDGTLVQQKMVNHHLKNFQV